MKRKRMRFQNGTTYLDRRRNIWYYRWSDSEGRRKCKTLGTLAEFPTKAKAKKEAEVHRLAVNEPPKAMTTRFEEAARIYMASDRFPTRKTTADGYRNNLESHAIPQWGAFPLPEVKALAVETWLKSMAFASKTRANIKDAMSHVFDYAMMAELLELARNPMELVRVKGSSIRRTEPLVLTLEQATELLRGLPEPVKTIATVALCLGLRRSELAGLKWSDFDWIRMQVKIQRSINLREVTDVKTRSSMALLPLDPGLVNVLRSWRSISEFKEEGDWVWASPWTAGEMPYDLSSMNTERLKPAAKRIGIYRRGFGWHSFRHTYRSWMNEQGTSLGVQQKLMRHSSPAMTAKYGEGGIGEGMRQANSNVVRMVIQ